MKPGRVFLDSCDNGAINSRYSVQASDPFLIFSARGGIIEITSADKKEITAGDPLKTLEELLAVHSADPEPYGPGAFGYISYEFGCSLQKLPVKPHDDLSLPDLWFAFFDRVTVYDHRLKRRMELTAGKKRAPVPFSRHPNHEAAPRITASESDYSKRYDRIMDHIARGNIYQANLAERFVFPWRQDGWESYQLLKRRHPTAYSAYLNTGRNQILSLSPELFLEKRGRKIHTAPIKGTVRGENLETLRSSKNRAEHIMIVDLERNDLGRVCDWGTISPIDPMREEQCGAVTHMVTTVQGTLRKDAGLAEILRAAFPGGSVTGAPKRKAMEIIGDLEPVVRGVYTGAIGWIGFSGDFVFNLPIRTVLLQDGQAFLYLGGGIVADSTARAEYREIQDKGEPFFKVLRREYAAPLGVA